MWGLIKVMTYKSTKCLWILSPPWLLLKDHELLANHSLVTLYCPCLEHSPLCQALNQMLSSSQCHHFSHSSFLFNTYYVPGTAHPSYFFTRTLQSKIYFFHLLMERLSPWDSQHSWGKEHRSCSVSQVTSLLSYISPHFLLQAEKLHSLTFKSFNIYLFIFNKL